MSYHEILTEYCSVETADLYDSLHRIGEGAFGEVRLGRCRRSGRSVALKAVQLPVNTGTLPKAVFREIESLRQLSCLNVISLLDMYPEENCIVLVLEHACTDLGSIIAGSKQYLGRSFIKQMVFMILNGLRHCHGAGIIHRDIKPANILISRDGIAKIGDFGLARLYDASSSQSMSHQVSTRWYRAPELLFASRHYSSAVDVWSTGAVVAEIFSLCPLFPGVNDLDQMFRVFQVMGTPSLDTWPGAAALPDYSKVSFPLMYPIELGVVVPNTFREDIDFLSCMLKLCPEDRLTCEELFKLRYFSDIPSVNGAQMFTNIRQFLGRHVENEKLVKKNKRTAAAELKRLEAASDDGLDASEIIWNECS